MLATPAEAGWRMDCNVIEGGTGCQAEDTRTHSHTNRRWMHCWGTWGWGDRAGRLKD